MKLYFENSQKEFRLVSDNVKDENAMTTIKKYIHSLNPNFKIYYIRTWMTPKGKCFDVGSHTEFFFLTDKTL